MFILQYLHIFSVTLSVPLPLGAVIHCPTQIRCQKLPLILCLYIICVSLKKKKILHNFSSFSWDCQSRTSTLLLLGLSRLRPMVQTWFLNIRQQIGERCVHSSHDDDTNIMLRSFNLLTDMKEDNPKTSQKLERRPLRMERHHGRKHSSENRARELLR